MALDPYEGYYGARIEPLLPKQYTVCDGCKVGLANDDWTHLDADQHLDDADRIMASVEAWAELVGHLTYVGPGSDGYFTCPCCGDVAIDGAIMETT
jgi:hypothetical protein